MDDLPLQESRRAPASHWTPVVLHLLKPRGSLLLQLTVIMMEQDEDAPRRSAVQAASSRLLLLFCQPANVALCAPSRGCDEPVAHHCLPRSADEVRAVRRG